MQIKDETITANHPKKNPLSAASEAVFLFTSSDSHGFFTSMMTTVSTSRDVKSYLFHVFQYPPAPRIETQQTTPRLESVRRYRDSVVWRLLCVEDQVDVDDLRAYWEVIDHLMDLSVQSAIRLLRNLYEYDVRKLQPVETRRAYPGVTNDLYRLEYLDEEGGYRDVCVDALLREAIELLQDEAKYLVRE